MSDTVKLELEVGDVEVEFEGPAEFARNDLLPLVKGLVEAIAEAQFGDMFEDDEDEEEDDDADAVEAAAEKKA